jgi:hypothetical protein
VFGTSNCAGCTVETYFHGSIMPKSIPEIREIDHCSSDMPLACPYSSLIWTKKCSM